MSTIVDIYCRSATHEPGTAAKLEQQEATCRAYCAEHGLTVGHVYRVIGSGLEYRGRPGLSEVRARYQNGTTSGMVVAHGDRLSRSWKDIATLQAELDQFQATLYLAYDEDRDNPLCRLILSYL